MNLISLARKAGQYAERAFAHENAKVRRKNKIRSIFFALTSARFTSTWFNLLDEDMFQSLNHHRLPVYMKPYRVYMSLKWDRYRKMKVIKETYTLLSEGGALLNQLIHSEKELEIFRIQLDEVQLECHLGYDNRYRKEGELVVSIHCKSLGGFISAASFSFEVLDSGKLACWIGCIQGHGIQDDRPSKQLQKQLHGWRPKAANIFIIQELAMAMGATVVGGSSDAIQAYRKKHMIHIHFLHRIEFNYDAVWEEAGGIKDKEGWYRLPLPPARKSMEEIKSNKRSLYRRRYQLMDQMHQEIQLFAAKLKQTI
ncbi:MAG: DUF535 domain-containing protein [Bacteroidetes bacterium]|nr:DUF535 domain-containing protein [Bacteroidota bacterium]